MWRCGTVASGLGFYAYIMTLQFHTRRSFLNQLNHRQFLETVFCTTGHKQYSLCSKGYGHSMMKRVYRRMGLSSLKRNSEVGPLAPAEGCWECGAMLWPGAGEQSRTDRCCAAASCAAANLENKSQTHYKKEAILNSCTLTQILQRQQTNAQ